MAVTVTVKSVTRRGVVLNIATNGGGGESYVVDNGSGAGTITALLAASSTSMLAKWKSSTLYKQLSKTFVVDADAATALRATARVKATSAVSATGLSPFITYTYDAGTPFKGTLTVTAPAAADITTDVAIQVPHSLSR